MNETSQDNPLTLSVVIPVFSSEQILPELCDRLSRVLPSVADRYEVILVNDGSRDRSWQVISQLLTKFEWLRGIDLMRNYGQHGAHICCFDVTDRTYNRTYSEAEVAFLKAHVPLIKFLPKGEPPFVEPQEQLGDIPG